MRRSPTLVITSALGLLALSCVGAATDESGEGGGGAGGDAAETSLPAHPAAVRETAAHAVATRETAARETDRAVARAVVQETAPIGRPATTLAHFTLAAPADPAAPRGRAETTPAPFTVPGPSAPSHVSVAHATGPALLPAAETVPASLVFGPPAHAYGPPRPQDVPSYDAARAWQGEIVAAGVEAAQAGHEEVLSNHDPSCPRVWVAPLPGEEAHWAVARLTPEAPRFEVTEIRYVLDNGGQKDGRVTCTAALAHHVEIFTADTLTPPARPVPLARWDVPAFHSREATVRHALSVSPPIFLEKGQHLFVAVQMAGRAPRVLCPSACAGPNVEASRNYWSKDGPPFPWPTLASYNLPYGFRFEAVGRVR